MEAGWPAGYECCTNNQPGAEGVADNTCIAQSGVCSIVGENDIICPETNGRVVADTGTCLNTNGKNYKCCVRATCSPGDKRCYNKKIQKCNSTRTGWEDEIDCGTAGCNTTTNVCNTPTITPIPTTLVCISGEKRCSDNILQKCNSTGTGWDNETVCGNIGCNSTTKTCNTPTPVSVCTNGNQKCTATNSYFTCNNGQWSTTITNCPTGQVCTTDAVGTNVCRETDYTAPSLNLFFAISGVKAVNPCFGDLGFRVNVAKDGQDGITGNVIATVVANKFNQLGDQVFKISNFALDNTYSLTDKVKIFISGKKTLATLYGKNSQTSGFGALNTSQILVSSLSGNTLDFSAYPVLNGDVGKEGQLGAQDGVVNAVDFSYMKNQWGNTCNSGQNLEADLNGDCRVDTFDLQILKNAMAEQYAQKTF